MSLIDIAEKIIQCKIPFVEGMHKLIGEAYRLKIEEDNIFQELRLIESETDHLPVGEIREQCSESFLKKIHEEEEFYRNDILKLCNEIIQKYNT